MKLQFKKQEFQEQGVNAICDLFTGQEKKKATFSVNYDDVIALAENQYGIGNSLVIDDETILKNMQKIQCNNLLTTTDDLQNRQFCIEMETGTGKTFVYTNTIFELNKRYGFTKFIIVVPSVSIREGVYKSLQVTSEYFANNYDNVPNRFFIYDSKKLSNVRRFAMSDNIEIMIINIDSFKTDDNIINQDNDKLGGVSAMRYIQDTNPIVIIDEPQSVDNTEKSKKAIESLNPLCTFRYSATHREKINSMYRLTPVDAFQKGLVKQIVVISNRAEDDYNKPYIKLISVDNSKGFKAKIEIDVRKKDYSITRKIVTVKNNSDLFLLSNNRDIYEGYQVLNIDCTESNELIEFTNTEIVRIDKALGDVSEIQLKKTQIKRTIETHLDKELILMEKNIKVLSLFFLDKVKNYREEDGGKGEYAKYFEECYEELISLEKYAPIRNKFSSDVNAIHDGYFSQDKKGKLKDTKGNTLDDTNTYNTIMKDKEWLLSFDCPLRFIWSHTALKEGWDNPNVFQVCTLIEQKSVFSCRQKIGRGLRLCVNQDGERIEDNQINTLHVISNESFTEFAETLQHEYEEETGMKFGEIQTNLFIGMTYEETVITEKILTVDDAKETIEYLKDINLIDDNNVPTENAKEQLVKGNLYLPPKYESIKENFTTSIIDNKPLEKECIVGKIYVEEKRVEKTISEVEADEIVQHFKDKKYIDNDGKMNETMKVALSKGDIDLPEKFENAKSRMMDICKNIGTKPRVRDGSKEVKVKLNKQVFLSEEFRELWDKIKQKTTYRVNIDTEKLVELCIDDIRKMPAISKAKILSQTAKINVEKDSVKSHEFRTQAETINSKYEKLPNIIIILSEATLLTRRTIHRILMESGRQNEFLINPQAFLEEVLRIIKHHRHSLAVDGISYIKLENEEYFVQEIFNTDELLANIDINAVAVNKSVYDYVLYDSITVEKPFAVALNEDPDVRLFFKIPKNFKIETPIGTYNPDWAVYMNKDGDEKLYLVVETKGTDILKDLRNSEQLKIHCGNKHFDALEDNIDFRNTSNWKKIKMEI